MRGGCGTGWVVECSERPHEVEEMEVQVQVVAVVEAVKVEAGGGGEMKLVGGEEEEVKAHLLEGRKRTLLHPLAL